MPIPSYNLRALGSRFLLENHHSFFVVASTGRNIQELQGSFRQYATRRDAAPSSLLSSALDRKQRSADFQREESVGPFQIGVSPQHGEKVKRWSELSTAGKVLRTTQRTTNLTVILLGAGLSAVLLYALTSELFSKNSPTVLYNEACERIKSSPQVAKYLHPPLTFHNNPPSVVRPRHRRRHVASQIAVDSSGREHMLLSFYVQGSSSASSAVNENKSRWVLDELTYDDIQAKFWSLVDSTKRAFRYLSGDVVPREMPYPVDEEKQKETERSVEPSLWGLTGLFKGLRRRQPSGEASVDTGVVWTEGEVHAELVRNDDGYFTFRYLLIDIPSTSHHAPILVLLKLTWFSWFWLGREGSEARNSLRVYVDRAPDVREKEPIVRFHTS
ncbi:TIM21-domain-containing protein [Pisolithus sp. B1]|nr:TIM21-domain-containing protein [Pisolithus sp. B1]